MARRPSQTPIVALVLALIAAVIGLFYALFSPSTPTTTSADTNVTIPLGTGALQNPGDIQNAARQSSGTGTNPQQAATVKPQDLNSLSF